MKSVILLTTIITTIVMMSPLNLGAQEPFCYPTVTELPWHYAGWLAVPPDYIAGHYHIGKDIDADEGMPVFSLTDGEVIHKSYGDWGAGNVALLIRHSTANNEEFVAVYGHIITTLDETDMVSAGEQIGTIGAYDPPHLHFGIHPGGTEPSSPFGMLDLPVTSPYNGWVDPVLFMATEDISVRKSTSLNNRNPYGWPQNPVTICGSNFSSPAWWFSYNPNNLYFADGTSKNCYLSLNDDSAFPDGGVVYDALGGARHAYFVGWEKWNLWEVLDVSCGSCPNPSGTNDDGQGGPNSCLGMPITNSYETGSGSGYWRQDFQKGYITNGVIYCYSNTAPGWTSSGWNAQYSYLFADAYDRNGASRILGNADGLVHVENASYPNIFVQHFNNDSGMIMYDQENWNGNDCATNEAYWVYGDIKTRYISNGGVGKFGCATIDQFYYDEKWCQDFKKGNQFFRIFATGLTQFVAIDPCDPVVHYQGAGGGPEESDSYEDVAVVYDYGTPQTRFHVLLSTGNQFNYQGDSGWYCDFSYPCPLIVQTMSGDFNGDGLDDICTMYNYGANHMQMHVFTSNGGKFNFAGVWTDDNSYPTSGVKQCVSGDFNNDGKADVAAMYYYGGTLTAIHTWLSTGSSLPFSGTWFYSGSYNGSKDVHADCTDVNGDGRDDIVTVYNFDVNKTRLHVFLSTGSAFSYQGDTQWWWSDGWDATKVKHSAAGYFDNDNLGDFAMMYDYGSNQTRIHTFLSTGSNFSYQGEYGWFWSTGYDANKVKHLVAGDFDDNGRDDLGAFYNSSGNDVQLHVWLSRDTTFEYKGDQGWWSTTGYPPSGMAFAVAGHYNVGLPAAGKLAFVGNSKNDNLPVTFSLTQNYPNPFNPVTTISYSLPVATHVTLDVYNILGQKIATLVDGKQEAGEHSVYWDGGRFSSGVYFYRLIADQATETKKMLLLK